MIEGSGTAAGTNRADRAGIRLSPQIDLSGIMIVHLVVPAWLYITNRFVKRPRATLRRQPPSNRGQSPCAVAGIFIVMIIRGAGVVTRHHPCPFVHDNPTAAFEENPPPDSTMSDDS